MKRLLLALLVTGFSQLVVAEGDRPFEFKGVPLGAPEADLVKAHPRFKCTGSSDRWCTLTARDCFGENGGLEGFKECFATMTYGGAHFKTVTARFLGERLSWVSISLSTVGYGLVRDALVQAFGEPQSRDLESFKTKGGLETTNEKLGWARGGSYIRTSRYAGDIETSSVVITTREALETFAQRRVERAKAGAKDL